MPAAVQGHRYEVRPRRSRRGGRGHALRRASIEQQAPYRRRGWPGWLADGPPFRVRTQKRDSTEMLPSQCPRNLCLAPALPVAIRARRALRMPPRCGGSLANTTEGLPSRCANGVASLSGPGDAMAHGFDPGMSSTFVIPRSSFRNKTSVWWLSTRNRGEEPTATKSRPVPPGGISSRKASKRV